MLKVTNKITAVMLCGLLIYNSLGYFLMLSVMRIAVRQQKWAQMHTIPDNQLTTFVFNSNTINKRIFVINNHEIIVDGKLYDVIKKQQNKNSIIYTCFYDKKEESLIAKTRLLNAQAQQSPLQNKARVIIEKIIKSGIIESRNKLLSTNYIIINSDLSKVNYSIPTLQIASPPPQSFC